MASPEGSEYVVSDNSSESSDDPKSVIDPESSNESDRQGGDEVVLSVKALQRLHSVFRPPHLRVGETQKGQNKRRKTNNRKAVYSGDSKMTRW